jgi:predicted protein tyrosine phosphatase
VVFLWVIFVVPLVKSKHTQILFVCSANKERSKTAEDYFAEGYPDFEFRSIGTNQKICSQEGTFYLNEEHLTWADTIYAMEQKHKKEVLRFSKSVSSKKVKMLNIPDHFTYYQKELLELLAEKVGF